MTNQQTEPQRPTGRKVRPQAYDARHHSGQCTKAEMFEGLTGGLYQPVFTGGAGGLGRPGREQANSKCHVGRHPTVRWQRPLQDADSAKALSRIDACAQADGWAVARNEAPRTGQPEPGQPRSTRAARSEAVKDCRKYLTTGKRTKPPRPAEAESAQASAESHCRRGLTSAPDTKQTEDPATGGDGAIMRSRKALVQVTADRSVGQCQQLGADRQSPGPR